VICGHGGDTTQGCSGRGGRRSTPSARMTLSTMSWRSIDCTTSMPLLCTYSGTCRGLGRTWCSFHWSLRSSRNLCQPCTPSGRLELPRRGKFQSANVPLTSSNVVTNVARSTMSCGNVCEGQLSWWAWRRTTTTSPTTAWSPSSQVQTRGDMS
jgi:hypothetical protein